MLYIMRHGRTVWNMEHKLQGKTDVPLSEAGRPVVEQAAAAYRDTHIDVCYCSPLIRAVETAEIVLRGDPHHHGRPAGGDGLRHLRGHNGFSG